MSLIESFESMLAAGQDNALLRYSLGDAYLKASDATRAVPHLAKALELDPGYSAAWKSYAKALDAAGDARGAIEAYVKGIEVAEAKGDKQAAKEMGVFLKRLQKASPSNER